MKPRKHQIEAITWCQDLWRAEKTRGIVQMPTGSGKSYVALIIASLWIQMGGYATILATSEEIVSQLRILALFMGLSPVIEMAEFHASRFARLVIGSLQTMWRRSAAHRKPKSLIIFDECHHVNFNAPVNLHIASLFEYAIGFSATPWSNGCADFFENRIYRYPLSQAIRDQVNCEFSIKSWEDPSPGHHQIVYCASFDEIKEMCLRIAPADYAVYKDKDARTTIARFRCGSLRTIVVNRMLTEGFDQPQIKRVFIARDTESEILALQMAGRALRPYLGQRAEIFVRSKKAYQTLQNAICRAG